MKVNNKKLEEILSRDVLDETDFIKHISPMVDGIILRRKLYKYDEDLRQELLIKCLKIAREKSWTPERGRAYSFFQRCIINSALNFIKSYKVYREVASSDVIDNMKSREEDSIPIDVETEKKLDFIYGTSLYRNKSERQTINYKIIELRNEHYYDNHSSRIEKEVCKEFLNFMEKEQNPLEFMCDILTTKQLYMFLSLFGGMEIYVPTIKKIMVEGRKRISNETKDSVKNNMKKNIQIKNKNKKK